MKVTINNNKIKHYNLVFNNGGTVQLQHTDCSTSKSDLVLLCYWNINGVCSKQNKWFVKFWLKSWLKSLAIYNVLLTLCKTCHNIIHIGQSILCPFHYVLHLTWRKIRILLYLYDFIVLIQRGRHSSLFSLSLEYSKMSCPKYYFLSFYLVFGRRSCGKNAQFILEVFLVLCTLYTTSHGRRSVSL